MSLSLFLTSPIKGTFHRSSLPSHRTGSPQLREHLINENTICTARRDFIAARRLAFRAVFPGPDGAEPNTRQFRRNRVPSSSYNAVSSLFPNDIEIYRAGEGRGRPQRRKMKFCRKNIGDPPLFVLSEPISARTNVCGNLLLIRGEFNNSLMQE